MPFICWGLGSGGVVVGEASLLAANEYYDDDVDAQWRVRVGILHLRPVERERRARMWVFWGDDG